jgi:hypothetical protein
MKLTKPGLQIPEDLKARYHAICVCAVVNEPFPHDVCVREEKRYIERIARLEAENACLTKGGCGKPGHTTFSGDEGTCYCLTCQLEAENTALKAQAERLSAPVSDQERVDFANCLSDGDEDHPCEHLYDDTDVNDLIATRVKETDHAD